MTREVRNSASADATPIAIDERADGAAGPWPERLRRATLGLLGALLFARPFLAGGDLNSGPGQIWNLAILLTAGLALCGLLAGGRLRFRLSWADAAVGVLAVLVAWSTRHAADRREAILMAWDWTAVALAYGLVRWLPRGKGESSALAAVLVSLAVGLAVYGLFQVFWEDPELRAFYLRDPETVLRLAEIPPDPASRLLFENRLLRSSEARSTMALANSLAGALVGPAVLLVAVAIGGLSDRRSTRPVPAVLVAGIGAVPLLACLVLTESRSAFLGFAIALAVAVGPGRARVPLKWLALSAASLALILGVLVWGALQLRFLDREMITEAPKSFAYRLDYWRGTADLLRSSPRVFWRGLGPGNFAGPYLGFKRITSSEEINDPHNMVLEVWTTAGLPAAIALCGAIGMGLAGGLRRSRNDPERQPGDAYAQGLAWRAVLIGWGIAGAWGLALAITSQPALLSDESIRRFAILGGGGLVGLLTIGPLWKRGPIAATAAAAGGLAIAINLLAAGGIAMPPVALVLWCLIGLGQNLHASKSPGRVREVPDGRWWGVGLALAWTALVGTFLGALAPYWTAQRSLAQARQLQEAPNGDFDAARVAILSAIRSDPLDEMPWLELANLETRAAFERGPGDLRDAWVKVAEALDRASRPPRNPNSVQVQNTRVALLDSLLAHPACREDPTLRELIQADRLNALARTVQLYPGSPRRQAQLALAAAELSKFDVASTHGTRALELDGRTPHEDKKLMPDTRSSIERSLPGWRQSAAASGPAARP